MPRRSWPRRSPKAAATTSSAEPAGGSSGLFSRFGRAFLRFGRGGLLAARLGRLSCALVGAAFLRWDGIRATVPKLAEKPLCVLGHRRPNPLHGGRFRLSGGFRTAGCHLSWAVTSGWVVWLPRLRHPEKSGSGGPSWVVGPATHRAALRLLSELCQDWLSATKAWRSSHSRRAASPTGSAWSVTGLAERERWERRALRARLGQLRAWLSASGGIGLDSSGLGRARAVGTASPAGSAWSVTGLAEWEWWDRRSLGARLGQFWAWLSAEGGIGEPCGLTAWPVVGFG